MDRNVKDLMTADPVTVSPDSTLREVAGTLSSEHIGGVPVVTPGHRLVGVISAADLVEFLASSAGPQPDTPDLSQWEREAEDADDDRGRPPDYFRGWWWPAPEGELPVLFGEAEGTEPDVFEGHTADEVMTRTVLTIGPDAPVADAAALMLDENVHRLLVVEDGQLLGVITTRDLIRVLAPARAAPPG